MLIEQLFRTASGKFVIPAKAGIQKNILLTDWIPAFAGMT